mgnify:CR=1 FL=1
MTNPLREDVCLCVFARAPVWGKVKTRLMRYMDAESACQLHRQLIDECLSRTVTKDLWSSRLWSTDTEDEFIATMSKNYSMSLHKQQGSDLGQRMAHAVKATLQSYRHVVLIGTDCPGLDAGYIETVLQHLQAGADCVLGPAEDGGYVMLALSAYDDSLFDDIEWGSSRVLAATRQRIKSLGWQCHEMPVLWDVERPEDYERLLKNE